MSKVYVLDAQLITAKKDGKKWLKATVLSTSGQTAEVFLGETQYASVDLEQLLVNAADAKDTAVRALESSAVAYDLQIGLDGRPETLA